MEQLDVRILDKEYRLAVSAEEKAKLIDAVRVVDDKMRAIRDTGRVSGLDRIAVMAALQLAHELLGARTGGAAAAAGTGEAVSRIRRMTEALDLEIQRQESLF
jgi:cell division protein ZapA